MCRRLLKSAGITRIVDTSETKENRQPQALRVRIASIPDVHLSNNFLVVGLKNIQAQSGKADEEFLLYRIIFHESFSSSTLRVNTEESEASTLKLNEHNYL